MDQTQTDLATAQDALRPLRQFVGVLSGALAGADQSLAGMDAYSGNSPYRYQTVSPYGVAIEGAPVATTQNGGLYISPMMMLLGIGAAAALLWKR